MTKANINNVKIGDKAYIEVTILDIREDDNYPILCDTGSFTKDGFRFKGNLDNQLYIKEEIPTLGEGVEMMVSDDNVNWNIRTVVGKTLKGMYICFNGYHSYWKFAKQIELTIEEQLANANKRIKELEEQLNEKQASE